MEKDSSESSDVFFPDRRQPVPETAARRTHRRAQRRKTLTRPKLEHLQTWAKPRPSWDTAVRTPPSAKAWTIRPSPFFPGTPPTRGIFSNRDATRSALRDPRFRVSPPRGTSASVTYVSYPDGPSVRAVSGARRRPSPPVQRSSTRHALPTHAALFVDIVSFFPQTLATGRAGARPTFTTTTANHARARLAPPSTSPATAAATRSTSPSVADPSTSATTAGAKAPSKVSTIRRCDERRFHSSHAPM